MENKEGIKKFEEVWQYVSDLERTDGVAPEPLTFQDGVASASVRVLTNRKVENQFSTIISEARTVLVSYEKNLIFAW